MKYRLKRPVEAFQLGMDAIPDWFMEKVSRHEIELVRVPDLNCVIYGDNGITPHWVKHGCWIVLCPNGEAVPLSPDIFAAYFVEEGEPAPMSDPLAMKAPYE